MRRRHAEWCLSLAREVDGPFAVHRADPWEERLGQEQDNIRAALAWLETQGDAETILRLATALYFAWRTLGLSHGREGLRWLTWALDRGDGVPADLLIRATMAAAWQAIQLGDSAVATALADKTAARAATIDDDAAQADVQFLLGGIARALDDPVTARTRLEEALARYRALGDRENTVGTLSELATLGDLGGVDRPGDPADLALAVARCEEALRIAEEIGSPSAVARALHGLAYAAYKARDDPRAASLSHDTLRLRWELHELGPIFASFEDLADIAGMTGQPRTAARLYGAAEALRELLETPIPPFYRAEYEREVAVTRAALDPAVFAAEYAAGRALPLAEAVAEALAVTPLAAEPPPGEPATPYRLSPRELDVVRLLVEGRSDREIGEALFLSYRSVGRYVTRILNKLDVDNRTAAATLAVRERLV